MRLLIVTGGDIDNNYASSFVSKRSFDYCIAVDGGLMVVDKLGLTPDMIIGDFDTVKSSCLDKYKGLSSIVRLNPVKDSTDTEEAVDKAIEIITKYKANKANDVNEIDILGGIGSRLDHSLANLFLIKKAYEKDIRIIMYNHNSKVFMVKGCERIKRDDNYKYISFIQFDGAAKGVTLQGFKYNVLDFDFDTTKTYRLGVSNEFIDEVGIVDIKEGMMLAIMTND